MKAEISIIRSWSGYIAIITIKHAFLSDCNSVNSIEHKGKGELKRKVMQFCSDLNLTYEVVV